MNAIDKMTAERVIRRLCVGAQIDGIRFGPVPQLLITDHGSAKLQIQGQVYVNLGSRWMVFPERPQVLPEGEDQLPLLEGREAYLALCELHSAEIVGAELTLDAPDLLLTLADGRVFFLNGRDPRYEPWQLGVAHARADPPWLVVATPENGIAVWAPDELASGSAAV